MRRTVYLIISLSLLIASSNVYGINVSGYISSDSTWSVDDSPVVLTGNVYVRNNATLTIDPGVEVQFNGRTMYIGYSSAGVLNANQVKFTNSSSTDRIYYRYNSSGTLSNCSFDNIYIDIENSSPTLTNDTILNVDYPIYLDLTSSPVIEDLYLDNVTNELIRLDGTTNGNHILKKYDLPYILSSNISIGDNDTLTIEPNVEIDLYSNDILVGNYSTPGYLIADMVLFMSSYSYNSYILYRSGSEGSITNSKLQNVYFNIQSGSPTFENDSITEVDIPIKYDLNGNPQISNIWLENVTNPEIQIGGTINSDLTISEMALPIGLHSNIIVRNDATLTLEKGLEINLNNDYINLGYSSNENGYLEADSISFFSEYYTDRFINFNNLSSGYIKNSHLNNVYIKVDYGNPVIENDSIIGVSYPVQVGLGANPQISNLKLRDITNIGIGITGSSNGTDTIPKLEYPYIFNGNISITNDDSIFIEKGTYFNFNNRDIEVGNYNSAGYLFADSVFFNERSSTYDANIYFDGNSGGIIENSILNNVYIEVEKGMPSIINDSIKNVEIPIIKHLGANPTIVDPKFANVTNAGLGLEGYSAGNDTVSVNNLPLFLSGDIYIQDGDSLFIEAGTSIDLGSENIYVGSNNTLGYLFANDVVFESTNNYDRAIVFKNQGGGVISNSKFINIQLDILDGNPAFVNDSILDVDKALLVGISASPVFENIKFKNVGDTSLFLQGNITESDTLKQYPYNFKLHSNISVTDDATLYLPSGTTIFMEGQDITLGSYSAAGGIKADSCFFINKGYNAYIYFYDGNDSSSITNSVIDGAYIKLRYGNPHIQYNNFINSYIAFDHDEYDDAVDAMYNYWGHYTGPTHDDNPTGLGGSVTDSVNYMPYLTSFYIKGVANPDPMIGYENNRAEINLNDTAVINFELQNLGGAAGLGIYTFSHSRNIEVTDMITGADSIETIEVGDTISIMEEGDLVEEITRYKMYRLFYNNFGSETKNINLTVTKPEAREGWIKHYLKLFPEGIDTSKYPIEHITTQYPTIGETNQENIVIDKYPILSPLEGVISSIRENDKYVYMTVGVDTFSVGHGGLDSTNFRVFEQQEEQRTEFKVIPPSEGDGSRLLDIVFVVDNSGSMSGEQNEVEENVLAFVDSLKAQGANVAFGLCRYANSTYIEDNGILTTDAEYFKNEVWPRNNSGEGSYEPGYDVSIQSVSDFSYRPGAQKIMIIITDETPDQGENTMEELQDICVENGITYFAFTLEELFDQFEPVADVTQGDVFDILDDFFDVISYISNKIANTYIIQYRTTFTQTGIHTITLEINWDGDTIYLTKDFFIDAGPQITRTNETKALENQSWPQGYNFTIEAIVKDMVAPFTQNVLLYYKNTNESDYDFVFMEQSNDSIWSAEIPTSAVGEPGLDYYFTASDGQETSSLPKSEPSKLPFQVGILPNYAPFITHKTITNYEAGDDLLFTAEVNDTTNYIEHVVLYHRYAGQLLFTTDTIIADAGNTYSTTISTDVMRKVNIEYYLAAWDNYGVRSSIGTADFPIVINEGEEDEPEPIDNVDEFTKTVQTYPNPVVDQIRFVLDGFDQQVTINMFSASGKKIHTDQYELNYNHEVQLDVSDYPKGMYYYSIESGSDVIYGNFMKSK